ncbi:trifunctional NAD biosynthesis/regulator protein NadR [Ruminiclostridium hungatei]|uniref:Trifunctional NAD biosynthesis/regulator protein NadR n=1 Tax=Ruminiclostridium hungatei TaxID=48256 RepID=A0A1V4SHR0_RUMHU|nr:AAA family ATPase [Ruminiclostridium hungatei]OPX42771.1 trifunctional NAD biosynthesis/regulator protein NadR [Ruminiclostridium hungatei]
MKYKCGMYGGSFNPLHLGHVRCIIEAANQCEELILVISEGINRDEIDIRVRYRWVYQLTKHIGNVRLFVLQDAAKNKEAYTEEYWMKDAGKVKEFAGKKLDVVFCGSDYDNNSFWAKCYPEAETIFLQRDDISSTKIRENVMAHWEWLPNSVKPYYAKKVLLIGGESTGKSTLAINLANYYNTNYLEEVGRDISERSGTDMLMLPEDFTDILLIHKIREREALLHSNKVLFEDTDCLITKFYIQFLNGKGKAVNEKLADAISELNNYDLILFLEPDVRFVQDGDRSPVIADDREHYSNRIKELYKERKYNIEIISGDYQERFSKSVSLIDKLLGRA